MSAPTRPVRRELPYVECPRCGVQVEGVDHNAGWIQHAMGGTRVGTYPDMPPSDVSVAGGEARIEPAPEFDRYVLHPCGDMLYPNEAAAVIAALRTTTTEAPK